MTKERKLAIQLWEEIRNKIIAKGKKFNGNSVINYKSNFCKKHDINWESDCWFCNYIKDCNKCPNCKCLKPNGSYIIAINENLGTSSRINACNIIIGALKGEIKRIN